MKSIKLTLFILFLCTVFPTSAQNSGKAFYNNPVIAGDLPDPSIIRVGETYYVTATSNDFAPIFPVFESKDLVNWEPITSVFSEPTVWAAKDFWAPELYYQNGTFYVYYTAKRKDNGISCIGVATSKDIHQGFTDHGILIEWGSEAIDGFVFRDDDGKLYISWKAYGLTKGREVELLCSELSNDGLSLVGETFSLTDRTKTWKGEAGEGQVLAKHNGFYYLLYSAGGCCTNKCSYHVRVARSKDLREGWEQLPDPILQSGDFWLCTGHGTLVNTPDSRWFYLYHSYNNSDFEYIGRQVLLDEMLWNEATDWPNFKNSRPSKKAEMPFADTKQQRNLSLHDDFLNDDNIRFWDWDTKLPRPKIQVKNGELYFTSTHVGLNFLGIRPELGKYELSSEVVLSDERAGIGIYSNPENVIALLVGKSDLQLIQINKGVQKTLFKQQLENTGSVYLKLEATGGRYLQFFKSEDGTEWIPFKIGDDYQLDCRFMPQWNHAPLAGLLVDGKPDKFYQFNNLKMKYSD